LNHGNWGTYTSINGWHVEDLTPGVGGIAPLEIQRGVVGGAPSFPAEWANNNHVIELDSQAEKGGTNGDTNVLLVSDPIELPQDGIFVLSFDFAARQKGSQIAATSEFKVLVDGEEVLLITDADKAWSSESLTLHLTAGTHTIAFAGGDADGSSDTYGALLDNIAFRQVAIDDLLYGDEGDDTLNGQGGVDALFGGDGNDTLIYDAADVMISGDAGDDTLKVTGKSTSLNLSDEALARLEHIDLNNGNGKNTVTLTYEDVLRVSDTGILKISGDNGDNVLLTGPAERGEDTTIDGQAYATFTSGAATVYVQLGLDLNQVELQAVV